MRPTDRSEGKVMRGVLFGFSLLLFGAGTYLVLTDKVAAAGTAFAAGMVSLIFVFLPMFRKFKGFGIEAELLERKIAEADDTIRRLKAISLPMAELLFTVTARLGRWGTAMPHRETYKMMQRIESELTKNGVSAEELEVAKENWHRFNMFDLTLPITKGIGEHLQRKVAEVNEQLQKLPSPRNATDPQFLSLVERQRKLSESTKILSEIYAIADIGDAPDRIEKWLRDSEAFTDVEKAQIAEEQRERLTDLKYYHDNHNFRSLERWFRLSDK